MIDIKTLKIHIEIRNNYYRASAKNSDIYCFLSFSLSVDV